MVQPLFVVDNIDYDVVPNNKYGEQANTIVWNTQSYAAYRARFKVVPTIVFQYFLNALQALGARSPP